MTTIARLLVVLVMLLHSWVAYSSIASGSHAPAPCVADCGPGDHDGAHSHDHEVLDSAEGDRAGHQHGHDPTDHSHDKPDLTRRREGPIVGGEGCWTAQDAASMKSAPLFNFERPPRRLPSI